MEDATTTPPESAPLNPDATKDAKAQQGPSFASFKEEVMKNKLFSACVLIDAILIICILGVTIGWLNFALTEIVDFDPAPGIYCMKCDKVESGVDKKNYFYSVEGDKCCSNKDGKYLEYVLSKHINKTLNEEFREKPLFQLCLNATTAEHPSASVKMVGADKTEMYKNHLELIYWDIKNTADNFLNNIIYNTVGTGVDKTGFQVKRAGYYHIYSNLVFDLKNETVTFPAIIRHLVLKFRKDYDVGEKLLEGYSTQCETIADTTFSSFIFGDFYITETDWVQVFVNDHRYLNQKKSYFGMYLI